MAQYKFALDKCRFCDADLSKVSPEVKAWKTKTPVSQCPNCGGFCDLVECESSQEPEPQPEPEPEPEPQPEPEPEPEPGPEVEPEE